MRKYVFLITILLCLASLFIFTKQVNAIVDPLAVPNNKFGIHIIQATPDESSPAASLVNTNGDWGYITVLVESKDRNHDKWQEFFNDLRRRHLIPLIRLATQPEDSFWKRPYEGEEQAWADFLDALNWPTKNRYIIIYNEPNHAKEWGNQVDAKSYAETLDKTITALKSKNRDFFVLNAGFDASAPSEKPRFEDELVFLKEMNGAIPGIFNKLDGWVSHSYPNPGFVGSPDGLGKGTVNTWVWELDQLKQLGLTKALPVFITETGWKHAEGLYFDKSLPSEEKVSEYYKEAFENAWSSNKIAAVSPFLLSYQEELFDHFSFMKPQENNQGRQFFTAFKTIQDLQKISGNPVQDKNFQLTKGEIYKSIVAGEKYSILLTFKNIGQSIWNDMEKTSLVVTQGAKELGLSNIKIPENIKVEPGKEYTFKLNLQAPLSGTYKVVLNIFDGQKQFDSKPLEFTTEVKSPVILRIKSALLWKKDFKGDYVLRIKGVNGDSEANVSLNNKGESQDMEAKYLLPDYSFEFSLVRPYYMPKTLTQDVFTGENTLDFGVMQPDIFSALFHPKALWQLLPFSK